MITAPTSKYVSASRPATSTTADQPSAASVPSEISVSIVAAPCRAFSARRAVERPAAPEDDRRRERERDPLPARELQRRHHREQRERHGQHGRDDESQRTARSALGAAVSSRRRRARQRGRVAGRLDRGDERVDGHDGVGSNVDRRRARSRS